jgi:hypothetical protein
MEPDEQTIRVIARFTEIGQTWPAFSWIYVAGVTWNGGGWWRIPVDGVTRFDGEISELEANQKGIFRKEQNEKR